MEKEIWAAIIQAVPVVGAAVVGFSGLNTWRKQLREGRQVKHAEKALAAAGQMFPSIRAARSPLSQFSEEEYDNHSKLYAAKRRIAAERLNLAWGAWQKFQEHYALAGLFTDPHKSRLDIAHEVSDCIFILQDHAETILELEEEDNEAARQDLIKARKALYGRPLESDPIEKRLCEAEAALQAELRPILLPKAGWLKAVFSGRAQQIP